MRKNLEYLYNVTRQMMGVLEVWQSISRNPEMINAQWFMCQFQVEVERELMAWGDDKLGLIASLGRGGDEATIERKERGYGASTRTTLTEVGLGTVTTHFMSGRTLLRKLASLTIVAAMLDLAKEHRHGDLVKAFEEMPDRLSHGR